MEPLAIREREVKVLRVLQAIAPNQSSASSSPKFSSLIFIYLFGLNTIFLLFNFLLF